LKKTLLFLFSTLLIFVAAMTVSANSAPPPLPNYFYCTVLNAPDNAVYFDILIEITPQDATYKETESNIKSVDSAIASYNENGYMSLTFHYKNLEYADNKILSPSFEIKDSDLSIDQISPTIKAVILDENGNILQISEAISTAPETTDAYAYQLTYDAAGNIATLQFFQSDESSSSSLNLLKLLYPNQLLIFLLFVIIRLALSVGIETLIAIPFKMRPLWKVPVVNSVTQLILIVFVLCSGISYITALIIGEIFVYIAEFVAYIYLYKSIPKWKIAIYTVVANTVTLAMGLLMNAYNILV